MFLIDWFWNILDFFSFRFRRNVKLLFLGLDNAGKTTLLNMLAHDRVISPMPTMQPNLEQVSIQNLNVKAWDLGGHQQARQIWKDYFVEMDGIVFLVDATDVERLPEARRELDLLLQIEELAGVPFLVLGNKIDKPGCVSEQVFRAAMGLVVTTGKDCVSPSHRDARPIEVYMCSVVRRFGFEEGFRWLSNRI